MKLPRRQVLHLAVGAAALPDVSPVAKAQAYPSRPVRINGQRLARGWTELPGDQRDRLCTRWRGGHRRRGRNNLGIEKYETSFRGTRRFIPAIPGGSLVHVRWQTHRHQHCFPWRWQDRSGHGLAIPIDMVRSVSIGSSKPAICVAVISLSASNSKPLWLATRTRYGTAEAFIMVVILAVVSGWPANRKNWSS